MNLVLVNYSSPSVAHVSGMRLWGFGRALAWRGHRVLFVTSDHGATPGGQGTTPADLGKRLAEHDWQEPLLLEVPEPELAWLRRAREGRASAPARAASILYAFVFRGGMFFPWERATRRYDPVIAARFGPDLVWATLGNPDAFDIAGRLARAAGCACAFDVKDPWRIVIPRPLRRFVARRYRGADLYTANGALQAQWARRWFGEDYEVVYSGFWSSEIAAESHPPGPALRLQFLGSFDPEKLADFAGWLRGLSGRGWRPPRPLRIGYAGAASDAFAAAMRPLASAELAVEVEGQLPFRDLVVRCRAADANAYFCSHERNPIHHKAIELLAHRRPVLVAPFEREEIRETYRQCGVPLYEVADAASLRSAVEAIAALGPAPQGREDALRRYTWETQAEVLEKIFVHALGAQAP